MEQEENLEKILEIESNQSEKVEKSPAHRSVYASEEHAQESAFARLSFSVLSRECKNVLLLNERTHHQIDSRSVGKDHVINTFCWFVYFEGEPLPCGSRVHLLLLTM